MKLTAEPRPSSNEVDAVSRRAPRDADRTDIVAPTLLGIAIFVPGHLFGWLVEWLWLGATCLASLLVIARRGIDGALAGWSGTTWLTVFGIGTALSCVSVGIAVAVRHAPFDTRDVAELVRLPIYALFCVVLATCADRWNPAAIDRVIALSIFFVIGCTVVYFTKFPVLYEFLNEFLYSDAKVMVEAGYVRISYPFANPNFLAFYLLLVMAYTGFFSPRPSIFFGALVSLFFTGSRSGWLAALPMLAVAYFLYAFRVSTVSLGRGTLFVWAIPAVLVALAIQFSGELQQFARLAELIDAIGDGGGVSEVRTADVRLAAATELLGWVERAPLLGWGPGRALGIDVADNQYLSWALAWGILGTSLMITALGMLFGNLLVSARGAAKLAGAFAFTLSLAAMLFTGDFLENYRLFLILAAMIQACHLSFMASRGRSSI